MNKKQRYKKEKRPIEPITTKNMSERPKLGANSCEAELIRIKERAEQPPAPNQEEILSRLKNMVGIKPDKKNA